MLLSLALILTGTLGCATRGGALATLGELRADETMPLFWRVGSERGATLYVLSSVHIGPPGGWAYPPAIERAFERSSALWVEAEPEEISGEHMQLLVARYGMLPLGMRLRDRVSPETWHLLQRELARSTLPVEAADRMQPWLVGNLLVAEATRRLGLSPRGGVDIGFAERAGKRSVMALESAEYQLSLLASLPEDLQEFTLRDALVRYDEIELYVSQLVDTWRVGDEAGLDALFFGGYGDEPDVEAFYEVFIYRRNREMAEQLGVLLEAEQHRGEAVFVVVGTGHLIGPRGIPALLADRGYEVSQSDRHDLLHGMQDGD